MVRENWSFSAYLEEVFMLAEINEIPTVKAKIAELIREMWVKFPNDCKDIGLKESAWQPLKLCYYKL